MDRGNSRNQSNRCQSTQITKPPKEVLAEFERLVLPICQSIIENFAEFRNVATHRDTLLPKLLSGEVSVTKAGLSPKTD
jgi:hypothetical protein